MNEQSLRAARQFVATSQLLGADFVPIRAAQSAVMETRRAVEAQPCELRVLDDGERASKQQRLDELRARHDAECPHCTNATAHTQTVFGEGNPNARLMFVGEAPGAEEDKTGRPFVGRAGQLLDKIIGAMGLNRDEVYIANVLKSRPPENATPTSSEAAKCGPYLLDQIRIIEPVVIVTLGKPAAQLVLGLNESMGSMRGRWHEYEGVPVMPTFHPAYLLRAYTPENRKMVWSDMQMVMERLRADAEGTSSQPS